MKAFGVHDSSNQETTNENRETKRLGKTSQERIFLARLKPLQCSQSFELIRREIEKKIEAGYTFQELAILYKMDPRIRKYLESMNAQIVENGRMIKTIKNHPKTYKPRY